MNTLTISNARTLALLCAGAAALAACGSTDDASTEAMPETVEMPADAALEPVAEEPVADPDALVAPTDAAASTPDTGAAQQAGDAAAQVAAEAAAVAEAADDSEGE